MFGTELLDIQPNDWVINSDLRVARVLEIDLNQDHIIENGGNAKVWYKDTDEICWVYLSHFDKLNKSAFLTAQNYLTNKLIHLTEIWCRYEEI